MTEYGWILGVPTQTDNTNYSWSLGCPFIRHDGIVPPPSFIDTGLRIWDGSEYLKIARRETPTDDDILMLYTENGYVRIALVEPDDANASRVYIFCGSEYRCLAKV